MAEEIVIDFLNWQTMVIELLIAGVVAAWFFWKQKQQGDKIGKLIINQEEFRKEQYETAVHRARSYLGSLHSDIAQLNDFILDPNVPPDMDSDKTFVNLLEFKNDMVKQLEHVVNQSNSVIEQKYLQLITDIIELAKNNPKVIQEDYGWNLDKSHCAGILSQISNILKHLPNPPV